ncbi:uncharacterized protein EV420DRAFT_1646221 [Desarmillaria tabescens]|uniref:Uncharacterized protein n=1 Tax=Armillaria tabescens TaxID=1929756 RepID=A0AA39JYF8_ARMTA|nr:uncharacterized protein EV420DRAFT_1646221 [Desarmillaria tabescens]KAK0451139.1 hypothetical protein EV420DRAFT_1646221 [Desarmillaria tabescens]
MSKLVWWPFIIAYVSSIVSGQPSVDAPYTVTKGETTTLGWSGESESLKIPSHRASTLIVFEQSIVVGDDPSASPLVELGSTSERALQYQWPLNPKDNDTRVAAAVHDGNGEGARSAPVPVIA